MSSRKDADTNVLNSLLVKSTDRSSFKIADSVSSTRFFAFTLSFINSPWVRLIVDSNFLTMLPTSSFVLKSTPDSSRVSFILFITLSASFNASSCCIWESTIASTFFNDVISLISTFADAPFSTPFNHPNDVKDANVVCNEFLTFSCIFLSFKELTILYYVSIYKKFSWNANHCSWCCKYFWHFSSYGGSFSTNYRPYSWSYIKNSFCKVLTT